MEYVGELKRNLGIALVGLGLLASASNPVYAGTDSNHISEPQEECRHPTNERIDLSKHRVYSARPGVRGVKRVDSWEKSDIREKGTGNLEVYFNVDGRVVPITCEPYLLMNGESLWSVARKKLVSSNPSNKDIGTYVEDIKTASGIRGNGDKLSEGSVIYVPQYPTSNVK